MTEDELRARLHGESAGLRPRGDLVEILARGHARRYRRGTVGLIGSSLVATAAVVAMLVGVFSTAGSTLPVDPAAPGDQQIIAAARQAEEAAGNMIINSVADQGDGKKVEGWALRSEKLARLVNPDVYDTTVDAAGIREEINYPAKTVTTYPEQVTDIVAASTPSGVGDPHSWLHEPSLAVHRAKDGTPYLTVDRFGVRATIWLDERTNLPREMDYGSFKIQFKWLPATDENRARLTHTVPPTFVRKNGPDNPIPPTGPTN
ncbi:hypothetical protein [Actinocrispum wychmicini]|nr:hypothetical protein [Actinocrispum wychmicini]